MIPLTPEVLTRFKRFAFSEVESAVAAAKDDTGFIPRANAPKLEGLADTYLAAMDKKQKGMSAEAFTSMYKGLVNIAENTSELPFHMRDDVQRMLDLNIWERIRSRSAEDAIDRLDEVVAVKSGAFVIREGEGRHLRVSERYPEKSIKKAVPEAKAAEALTRIFTNVVHENRHEFGAHVRLADMIQVYHDDLFQEPMAYGLLLDLVTYSDFQPVRVAIYVGADGCLLANRKRV